MNRGAGTCDARYLGHGDRVPPAFTTQAVSARREPAPDIPRLPIARPANLPELCNLLGHVFAIPDEPGRGHFGRAVTQGTSRAPAHPPGIMNAPGPFAQLGQFLRGD